MFMQRKLKCGYKTSEKRGFQDAISCFFHQNTKTQKQPSKLLNDLDTHLQEHVDSEE